MLGSLHFADRAIDLDTEEDLWEDLVNLHEFLVRHLPSPYEVIFEEDHVHVEIEKG